MTESKFKVFWQGNTCYAINTSNKKAIAVFNREFKKDTRCINLFGYINGVALKVYKKAISYYGGFSLRIVVTEKEANTILRGLQKV